MTHKAEMDRRKAERASRTPGFTPITKGGRVWKKNEMPLLIRKTRAEERRNVKSKATNSVPSA